MGMSATKEFSDTTAATIDEEVRAVIDRNYTRAQKLLQENIDILHAMAEALMKYETLDSKQVDDLMSRRPVSEPEGWSQNVSNDNNMSGGKPAAKPAEAPIISISPKPEAKPAE
jgi:cell division protease FtsH